MEKAQEILKHIDELYCIKVDLKKIENMPETNPTMYEMWSDAFKDYDLPDVLTAIDNFWEFKSSKTKPNVAQIKAILTSHKAEKLRQAAESAPKKELPSPENLMAQDVDAGCCRNNLYVYREAYDICLDKFLREVVPDDVVDHAFWPRNVQLAVENGVFGRFDEAMLIAAQRRFGRDYEFPSANDLEAMKNNGHYKGSANITELAASLASHWRAA